MWKRQRKQSRTSKEGTHFSHSQTAPSNVLVRLFRLFTIQLIIITNELNLCKARQKMYPFAIPRENTASMKMNRCSAKDHVHSRGGVQEGRSPGQHPISHCSSRYENTMQIDQPSFVLNLCAPVLFGVKKYADALWEVVKGR